MIRTLEGQVADFEALVGVTIAGDNWSVADKRVVNARVRHQVGLELVQIDIERSVKAKTGGDGADDLGNQAVEMLVAGTRDVKVAMADVIHGFVVNEESAVRVFDCAVGGQDSVVWLNNGCGDTGGRVYGEFELGFLAIVGGEPLEKKSTETGASATAEGVEDQEALKGGAVV
jgi:hypothetical protein